MAKSFDSLVKRTTTKATRTKAAAPTKELLGELLMGEMRQAAGQGQRQVAKLIGMNQPGLARIEKQSDIQVSALQKIVEALGGELEIVAKFSKGTIKISQFVNAGRKAVPRVSRISPTEVQLF
jgi:hypothetical protein